MKRANKLNARAGHHPRRRRAGARASPRSAISTAASRTEVPLAAARGTPRRTGCPLMSGDAVTAEFRSSSAPTIAAARGAARPPLRRRGRASPSCSAGCEAAGIDQAVLLSTCDRIEVQAVAADAEAAAAADRGALARPGRRRPARRSTAQSYRADRRRGAAPHLRRRRLARQPASSASRRCWGRSRRAIGRRAAAGLMGGSSRRRCRRPTPRPSGCAARPAIGRAAGLDRRRGGRAGRSVHGDLGRCAALLIGTGEMGELVIAAACGAPAWRGCPSPTPARARAALIAARHRRPII